MILIVLCRFSLLVVKYFLKHIEQRHSLGFARGWLPSSNEWATGLQSLRTKTDSLPWRVCWLLQIVVLSKAVRQWPRVKVGDVS